MKLHMMIHRDSFSNKKLVKGKFKKMEAPNESINNFKTFAHQII